MPAELPSLPLRPNQPINLRYSGKGNHNLSWAIKRDLLPNTSIHKNCAQKCKLKPLPTDTGVKQHRYMGERVTLHRRQYPTDERL